MFGAGYWGTKILREYARLGVSQPDFNLEYVVDSSTLALERIKGEIGTKTGFESDYRAVLDTKVDAVHIALPNSLHYEVARDALEAGKHVLIEKPMALNSRDAFKLVSLAEESGLVLQVGHIFRFNDAVRMVRRLIGEGKIGRAFYLKLDWAATLTPPRDTDIVFDLAPHPVDALNFILDEWPSSVEATGGSYLRKTEHAEEMAFINLEFPDRILASIYVSWIQHGVKDRMIRVVGEKGTIVCDALNQTIMISNEQGPTNVSRSQFPSSGPRNGADAGAKSTDAPNNTIRDMELNFIESTRGRVPQYNSGFVGARTVSCLEAIVAAMRKNDLSLRLPLTPVGQGPR
ncbi:MAG: Gfo/Idh/MocA family oxidoreductase [Nitrososphaerota archaeon]|nr:Gfo/Idh/MocA family oxidoreductase [Nitrososphaerota archaeon]MDG7014910.1 Gfo/Idh/MocA family oxidoreductase [Nitrososphaerota archaeon]WGO50870.1 MAG: Gfo/Idh/MocA family oxidoreductase [Nitrososphaerota archaeon]